MFRKVKNLLEIGEYRVAFEILHTLTDEFLETPIQNSMQGTPRPRSDNYVIVKEKEKTLALGNVIKDLFRIDLYEQCNRETKDKIIAFIVNTLATSMHEYTNPSIQGHDFFGPLVFQAQGGVISGPLSYNPLICLIPILNTENDLPTIYPTITFNDGLLNLRPMMWDRVDLPSTLFTNEAQLKIVLLPIFEALNEVMKKEVVGIPAVKNFLEVLRQDNTKQTYLSRLPGDVQRDIVQRLLHADNNDLQTASTFAPK